MQPRINSVILRNHFIVLRVSVNRKPYLGTLDASDGALPLPSGNLAWSNLLSASFWEVVPYQCTHTDIGEHAKLHTNPSSGWEGRTLDL